MSKKNPKKTAAIQARFQTFRHYAGRKLCVIENTTKQFELQDRRPAAADSYGVLLPEIHNDADYGEV